MIATISGAPNQQRGRAATMRLAPANALKRKYRRRLGHLLALEAG